MRHVSHIDASDLPKTVSETNAHLGGLWFKSSHETVVKFDTKARDWKRHAD